MSRNDHRFSLVPVAYGVFLGAIILLLGLSAMTAGTDEVVSDEPGITFSHRLHVEDAGMACEDCHSEVTASTKATDALRPGHTNCESCHEAQLNEDCSTCHINDPLEYVVPVRPDRGLVFSHVLHAEKGAACLTCHAGIEKLEASVRIDMPAMATCNTCHNDVEASNTCESCHTDLALLRPREHNRTDFLRFHKQLALDTEANCASCHTEESCVECHNGAELVTVNVPGSDLQVPHAPRTFAIARGQGQTTLKVHDATFRFTHGVIASQKNSECQTCHQTQDFCAACHFAGGNVNQAVFRPSSHSQPGFMTFGVGSGGGLHAREAKRDIENCASCHDVEAADPTCIVCHSDNDGIRGTNPRTHLAGFMRGERGDWHDDPGANCYVCHTDPNARPGGVKQLTFCGYCHN